MKYLSELVVLVFILNIFNCNGNGYTVSVEVDPKFCQDIKFSNSGNEITISIDLGRFKRIVDIPCTYKMINGKCVRISDIRFGRSNSRTSIQSQRRRFSWRNRIKS